MLDKYNQTTYNIAVKSQMEVRKMKKKEVRVNLYKGDKMIFSKVYKAPTLDEGGDIWEAEIIDILMDKYNLPYGDGGFDEAISSPSGIYYIRRYYYEPDNEKEGWKVEFEWRRD